MEMVIMMKVVMKWCVTVMMAVMMIMMKSGDDGC